MVNNIITEIMVLFSEAKSWENSLMILDCTDEENTKFISSEFTYEIKNNNIHIYDGNKEYKIELNNDDVVEIGEDSIRINNLEIELF